MSYSVVSRFTYSFWILWWIKRLSDLELAKVYLKSGVQFACTLIKLDDSCSKSLRGDFDIDFSLWKMTEQEYCRRGYRTSWTIHSFIDHAETGIILIETWSKREAGEPPILHARIFQKECLEKRDGLKNFLCEMWPGIYKRNRPRTPKRI